MECTGQWVNIKTRLMTAHSISCSGKCNYGTECSDQYTEFCYQILTIRMCKYTPVQRFKGTAVVQWFRRSATNQKVAGLIPDGVTGIFH